MKLEPLEILQKLRPILILFTISNLFVLEKEALFCVQMRNVNTKLLFCCSSFFPRKYFYVSDWLPICLDSQLIFLFMHHYIHMHLFCGLYQINSFHRRCCCFKKTNKRDATKLCTSVLGFTFQQIGERQKHISSS